MAKAVELSEQYHYLESFLYLVQLLKWIIRDDRDGDWQLHLYNVQKLLPLFHVFDRVNYARWASLYLKDMRNIENEHPTIYCHFVDGHLWLGERNVSLMWLAPTWDLSKPLTEPRNHVKV